MALPTHAAPHRWLPMRLAHGIHLLRVAPEWLRVLRLRSLLISGVAITLGPVHGIAEFVQGPKVRMPTSGLLDAGSDAGPLCVAMDFAAGLLQGQRFRLLPHGEAARLRAEPHVAQLLLRHREAVARRLLEPGVSRREAAAQRLLEPVACL